MMFTKTWPPLGASLAALALLAAGGVPAAQAQLALPVPPPQAFVVNSGSNTVTPINLTTNTAGPAISVGKDPGVIAALPDGRTVYVANKNSGTITPINVAADLAGQAIRVGIQPDAIVVTPNGKTIYVADSPGADGLNPGVVVPVTTKNGNAGKSINVGDDPTQLTMTPDGTTLLVLVSPYPHPGPTKLTSISTTTNKLGKSVTLPRNANSVTIAPGGKVAYVSGAGPAVQVRKHLQLTGVITPVTIATMTKGKPITLGNDPFGGSLAPTAVMLSSNGKWAYVVYPGVNGLDRVNLTTGKDTGNKIRLSVYPNSGVLSADGNSVFVHTQQDLNVVDLSTGACTVVPLSSWGGPAVPYPFANDIALAPDGKTVYSLAFGKTNGSVIPVREPGDVRGHPIPVGVKPVEMVIVP